MKHLLVALSCITLMACSSLAKSANDFQKDADLIRLEHLDYWSGLIEEYHAKAGEYPFQNQFSGGSKIGLVKIATLMQQKILSPGHRSYNKRLDNNSNGRFQEFSVKAFVAEIERVLGREIAEKYDIQKVPTSSPVGYFYFVENDGYLIWTTCTTCDVTLISTLLYDGYTATVNIGSTKMAAKVHKALTREEMLSHPIYKGWRARSFQKEDYVRGLVSDNERDSKAQ